MIKKFIVTDPCYIMSDSQYQTMVSDHWSRKCSRANLPYPIIRDYAEHEYVASKRVETIKGTMRLHAITSTTWGDGGCSYRGQAIAVDSGQLCIAERPEGWEDERWGVTCASLEVAQRNLERFLKKI